MNKESSFKLFSSLVFLLLATASTRSAVQAEENTNKMTDFSLGEVLKNKTTGLQMDADHGEVVRKQAEDFVALKHPYLLKKVSKKTKKSKTAEWVKSCPHSPEKISAQSENVFCEFMFPKKRERSVAFRNKKRAKVVLLAAKVKRLLVSLKKGNPEALAENEENEFHRAFRQFKTWTPLEEIAKTTIESKKCVSASLVASLAQKAEEFFPDRKLRDTAITLYTLAVGCAKTSGKKSDEVIGQKAAYRLSLLHIWDKNYAKAEPFLIDLSDLKNGDFTTRGLYWRIQAAKAQGNTLLADALKTRLLKENPLSFHGLLMARDATHGPAGMATTVMSKEPLTGGSQEPIVRFRSGMKPELNKYIRAVEALQELKAFDLAEIVINKIEEKTEESEPSIRLYIGVLLDRSGDSIGKFKMLSSVFRDQPNLITKHALELFYPLKRFDTLNQYEKQVDPYLVAALIRQESGFIDHARSPAGAMGLMQVMPATARRMERVSKRALYDPSTNVRVGVKFFRKLLDRFDSDAELALAAYNAGPGRVDEWLKRYPIENRILFLDLIPFKETRDYVALIARNYFWYLHLYSPDDTKLRHLVKPRSSEEETGPMAQDLQSLKGEKAENDLKNQKSSARVPSLSSQL